MSSLAVMPPPKRETCELPRFGLGCAPLGNLFRQGTDDHAEAVLEAAWDVGVRHFDTAPHYGLGLSEQRLGRFLVTKPRDEYVVSTKVGRLLPSAPDRSVSTRCWRPRGPGLPTY